MAARFAIVLLQFAVVVLRYVFGIGSIWLSESVIYGHAAMFMLAAAWTLQAGGHVRVDIFYADASPRTKALVDLFGSLLLLLPFVHDPLVRAAYIGRSWALLERSRETSGLPFVYPLETSFRCLRCCSDCRHLPGDSCRARAARERSKPDDAEVSRSFLAPPRAAGRGCPASEARAGEGQEPGAPKAVAPHPARARSQACADCVNLPAVRSPPSPQVRGEGSTQQTSSLPQTLAVLMVTRSASAAPATRSASRSAAYRSPSR